MLSFGILSVLQNDTGRPFGIVGLAGRKRVLHFFRFMV